MTKGAFLYQEAFKNHFSEYYHPECPERLDAVIDGVSQSMDWPAATKISPRQASFEELQRVHDPDYLTVTLARLDCGSFGHLDPDTFFSPGTKKAALDAAGGGIDLAFAVHDRKADFGWALVRPPGHHANAHRASGFCIFNNIAVSVASVLTRPDVSRVAIFDWDVHHGNGTQDIFWNNPDVLFMSVHQWPHYPGSGTSDQIGGADAMGRTVNFPFPAGTSDNDFLAAIDKAFVPMCRAFKPDHIFVSAGFDAHRLDPLAGMDLTSECFGKMARRLKLLSNELCQGRMTMFLEGGYHLKAISESCSSVINGIAAANADASIPVDSKPSGKGMEVIDNTLDYIHEFWSDLF